MENLCGADCRECCFLKECKGCACTGGNPFGKGCIQAEYLKVGGKEKFDEFKQLLITEINNLNIEGMEKLTNLNSLCGKFVNVEYLLPSGEKVKFLNDNRVYLGNQVHCIFDENYCFGVVADTDFILVCKYGENGTNPEIVIFVRR